MIRSLKNLLEIPAHAGEEKIGKVKDMFFDDHVWRIRYFVIETGGFLTRQQILVAAQPITVVDGDEVILDIDLTKDQILSSPDVDADKPVSRQHEIQMAAHYGWPAYWTMEPVGGVPVDLPVVAAATETPGDPHLRSFRELRKYEVKAADGPVGELDDLLADDGIWRLDFLVVTAGDWSERKQLLVDTGNVRQILFGDQVITAHGDRRDLIAAPEYQPAV